ncbi:MAG TPA: acyltransferase, partial [Micromonosporaceae bacterium]
AAATGGPAPSTTTPGPTTSSAAAVTTVAARPATSVEPQATTKAPPLNRRRLTGLDGIRGLAALFVVVHHSYLSSYPGYPAITGPWWASWFIYGHFSVVVFIVLSGFSLSVSAARNGWWLGGKAKFAKRRAWRILPPYWAALAFSLAIAWAVLPQPGEGSPTVKSVVINGLLVQDIFEAPSPNGAFWSIAVEAQLYIVFPLMLLLLRRGSAAVMLSVVGCAVALIGILAPSMPVVEELMRLTPQFAVLFALGVVAAGIMAGSPSAQRLPWHWFAAFAAVPVFALIDFRGSIWTVAHFFWVDMLIGIPVALLLAAVATGHPAWLLKALDLPPIRRLGSFSYSLYLIHAPILIVVSTKFVAPHLGTGSAAFLATAGIAGTISVAFAWLFATVFEIPFQRHRSWEALRGAARTRILRVRAVTDPSNARLVAAAAIAEPVSEHVTEPRTSGR